MGLLDLVLLGINTKETISLGPGLKSWALMAFRGPVFSERRIGFDGRNEHVLLPADLLQALYGRFAVRNPHGILIVTFEEAEELAFSEDLSEDEKDAAYDSGETLCNVFDMRWPNGVDPLKTYLPELFEVSVHNRLTSDPTLDAAKQRPDRPPDEVAFLCVDRHFRWSDWWLKG
jgi:hypothetical protein